MAMSLNFKHFISVSTLSLLLLIGILLPKVSQAQGAGRTLNKSTFTENRLDIEARSLAIGLKPINTPAGDSVVTNFIDNIVALKKERFELVQSLQRHALFTSLGRSFLHSLFDRKAIDPSNGELIQNFDAEFIKTCAAANDMTSIRHWETFRNQLLERELPLADEEAIKAKNLRMPTHFNRDYPIYLETVKALQTPIIAFDRELPNRIGTLQKDFGEQFFATYSNEIASLPKSDFETLQRVKAALESDQLRSEMTIIVSETSEAGPAYTTSQSPPPSPEANVATNRKLPTIPCRLISIPLPGVKLNHSSIEVAEREDITDFVKLGQSMRGNYLLAIRANGQPVAFLLNQKLEPEIQLPAISAEQNNYEGKKLIWLDSSGQLHTLDGPLPDLGNVDSFQLLDNYLFTITTDGTRQLSGPNATHPNVRLACNDLQNVVSIQGPHVDHIDIVTRDGEFFRAIKGEKPPACSESATKLLSHDLALSENNQLLQRNTGTLGPGESFSKLFPSSVPRTAYVRNGIAIIGDGTRHYFLREVDTSNWEISRKWEEALKNAVEIQIHQNQFVHALIPFEKVPRSGHWTLEDLAAHNTTLP